MIGRGLGDRVGADHHAAARLVLDDDRAVQAARQLVGDDACDVVHGAPGAKRDHDGDCLAGVIVGTSARRLGKRRHRKSGHCQSGRCQSGR
jgi:hypothetical protein